MPTECTRYCVVLTGAKLTTNPVHKSRFLGHPIKPIHLLPRPRTAQIYRQDEIIPIENCLTYFECWPENQLEATARPTRSAPSYRRCRYWSSQDGCRSSTCGLRQGFEIRSRNKRRHHLR